MKRSRSRGQILLLSLPLVVLKKKRRGGKKEKKNEIEIEIKRGSFVVTDTFYCGTRVASGAWQHRRCLERCNRAITVSTSPPPLLFPLRSPLSPSLRRRVTTRMKIVITRTVATIIASVSRLQFATVWKRSGWGAEGGLLNESSCNF